MNHRLLTTLICSALILSLGCQRLPTSHNLGGEPIVMMQKTPCYGPCPVYILKIYPSGWATLDATQHLKLEGTYTQKLSDKYLKRLEADFEQAKFFELQDTYTTNLSDLPTTYLTYRQGGRSKTVMDYYGAPERLKQLEAHLEALVMAQGWRAHQSKNP